MKMFKNYAAIACSALVALALTACHTNDVGNGSDAATTTLTVKGTNKLVIQLSKALPAGAQLTYNGVTVPVSGTTATLEGVADGKTLALVKTTPTSLVIPQSTVVNFGERDLVVVNMDVVEEKPVGVDAPLITLPSSPTAPDQEAKDELIGATGTIKMSSSTIQNQPALVGQKFSITLFTPTVAPLTEYKLGAAEAAPLAAACTPSGATFNPAVSFEATLPGADGCEVYCKGTGISSSNYEGVKLTASMSSFAQATYPISVKYNITAIEDTKEQIAFGSLNAGTSKVSYEENFGFESDATGIIDRLFCSLFGTKALPMSMSVDFKVSGPSNYVIYQEVKTLTIVSGSRTFTVKVYGKVTTDIQLLDVPSEDEPKEPEIVPTHNGGSN
jgi:hypothetical protein